MGLFTPKISAVQMDTVNAILKQLRETANVINTTVKPDVFFGRLNFALDCLLELQKYEKYKIFKKSTPSADYKRIIKNLNKTVDNFIDRAIENNHCKFSKLKTNAAKMKSYKDFIIALISAFDCAHTFWTGNTIYPHYTGPLFTRKNYQRALDLFYGLDNVI